MDKKIMVLKEVCQKQTHRKYLKYLKGTFLKEKLEYAQLIESIIEFEEKYKVFPTPYDMLAVDDSGKSATVAALYQSLLESKSSLSEVVVEKALKEHIALTQTKKFLVEAINNPSLKGENMIDYLIEQFGKVKRTFSGTTIPTVDYTDQDNIDKFILTRQKNGIKTGFPTIDSQVKGGIITPPHVCLVIGKLKGRKTTTLRAIVKNLYEAGKKILIVDTENGLAAYFRNLVSEIDDFDFGGDILEEISILEKRINMIRLLENKGIIKIAFLKPKIGKTSDVKQILEDYKDNGLMFDAVIIDNVDNLKSTDNTKNSYDNHVLIYHEVVDISNEYEVPVFTQTQVSDEHFTKIWHDETQLYFGISKAQTVHMGIAVQFTPKEYNASLLRLTVPFQRDGRHFSSKVEQVEFVRVEENNSFTPISFDEYNRIYEQVNGEQNDAVVTTVEKDKAKLAHRKQRSAAPKFKD